MVFTKAALVVSICTICINIMEVSGQPIMSKSQKNQTFLTLVILVLIFSTWPNLFQNVSMEGDSFVLFKVLLI